MEFRYFYGDDRIKPHIVYKKEESYCIYCGDIANSREHTPSKVFLVHPYPDNLFLVPSCKKCNNSFSDDELYLWFVIEILKQRFSEDYTSDDRSISRFSKYTTLAQKVNHDICRYLFGYPNLTIWLFKNDRIDRVIKKLAIGHAVFELSEGYYTDSNEWHIEKVDYAFLPSLSKETIDTFDIPIDISGYLLPEIGSRAFDNIIVLELYLQSTKGQQDTKKIRSLWMDWTVVQERKYKYICVKGNYQIYVGICISEFLFASIIFSC